MSGEAPGRVGLRELALSFLKLGAIGFGGGVGMLAILRDLVVERRRWLSDRQMSAGIAIGQMLPGPFITNCSGYVGYELRGPAGMAVALVALLIPCLLLTITLSWLYFRFGTIPVVERIFAGVQPVVVAILAWAAWSIGRKNVRSRRNALIAAGAAAAMLLRADAMLVVLVCGALGILLSRPRRLGGGPLFAFSPWLGVMAAASLPAVLGRAGELAFVFLKVGTVVFGGGFAAIPFLQHEVVDLRGWLTMKEFIDGVAIGQITPGPVAITASFIGYKVLGIPGALIAALGTFLPSAFFVVGLTHVYRRIDGNVLVLGFLAGVMPAIVGMIVAATVLVGRSVITGPLAAVLAPLALLVLLRWRADPLWLILGGAAVGLLAPG